MSKEVVIVGRNGCSYTQRALRKARDEGYNYTYVEVDTMPSDKMGQPFASIAAEKGHITFPCIFEVKYIGGFNDWK